MIKNHIIISGDDMANSIIIKERIKEAIQQSGITQTELSKMLSVSASCVAHYVKGDILPSLETFTDLCVILEVEPAYILGLEN